MNAEHVRMNGSPLAAAEKRALVAIARRLPGWVTSDQLSGLGLVSMGLAGAAFWAGQFGVAGLVGVVVALGLNWFGDSLDGTLARVRRQERPRFGFYVDHVIDIAGVSLLLVGIALSGFMSPIVAVALLAAYLLVSAEVYLATHAHGAFRMSFLGFGPTELRIVLAVGALALLRWPVVSPFGVGPWKLFDIGGVVALAGLVVAFVVSAGRNTWALYQAEPLPAAGDASLAGAAAGRPATNTGRATAPAVSARVRRSIQVGVIVGLLAIPAIGQAAGPEPETRRAWSAYVAATDARIVRDRHRTLDLDPALRRGDVVVEPLESRDDAGMPISIPNGLVHHWRGRVFVPGLTLDRLLQAVQALDTFERQPDVRAARILRRTPDGLTVALRITRSQFVTATYDTEHDVRYARLDPARALSVSTATRITELDGASTGRARAAADDRGFLWGLQAWWRYQAVGGGVVVECESVSLSRTVPLLVRPFVGPLVTRFARESMVRTLGALREAIGSRQS